MLRIRLSRVGRKNLNIFRIVVAEHQAPIKGRFVEILGTYNPNQEKDNLKIDEKRVKYWMSVGAKPTDTVINLLVDSKILPAKEKIKKTTKKKSRKKEEKIEKPEHIESPSAPQVQQESPLEEAIKEEPEEPKEDTKEETEKKPKEQKSTEEPSDKDKKE